MVLMAAQLADNQAGGEDCSSEHAADLDSRAGGSGDI